MMNFKKSYSVAMVLILAAIVSSSNAFAGIVLNGTRYVYPSKEKEINIEVINKADKPVLIRSWIDDGDAQEKPELIKVPFILNPPFARVEPSKSQALRLSYIGGDGLPNDRESLFWLNVHEIPSMPSSHRGEKAKNIEQNGIQFAFRYRLKLFYRPSGLSGTAQNAASELSWSRDSSKEAGGMGGLIAHNDTPYYVSIGELKLVNGDDHVDVTPEAVAPFSSLRFKLNRSLNNDKKWSVSYISINEWGGLDSYTKPLDR